MKICTKWHTTQCDEAVSIGNKSLTAVHFHKDEEGRMVTLAIHDPDDPRCLGGWGSRALFVELGREVEIFPEVKILIAEQSSRHKVKFRIRAPASVPISSGYPYERTPVPVASAS